MRSGNLLPTSVSIMNDAGTTGKHSLVNRTPTGWCRAGLELPLEAKTKSVRSSFPITIRPPYCREWLGISDTRIIGDKLTGCSCLRFIQADLPRQLLLHLGRRPAVSATFLGLFDIDALSARRVAVLVRRPEALKYAAPLPAVFFTKPGLRRATRCVGFRGHPRIPPRQSPGPRPFHSVVPCLYQRLFPYLVSRISMALILRREYPLRALLPPCKRRPSDCSSTKPPSARSLFPTSLLHHPSQRCGEGRF